MSGATFPRNHVWISSEDLDYQGLNSEFDNILNNLNPAGVNGYEDDVTQMQKQTSPGAVGTEVLATSLGGELERIRFALARALGTTYWYTAPAISLANVNTLLAATNTISNSRSVSGRVRSATDGFPIFLVPDGTAATVTLKGATTPFVYYIDGTQYTISTDITATGLALATAGAAQVNDALLTGQTDSLYAGEHDSAFPTIGIDTLSGSWSLTSGQIYAFYHGGTREYFTAISDSGTSLSHALRGLTFDSADAPQIRQTFADNAAITLAKIHWVYATTSGTITTSTTNPVFSSSTPVGAVAGDYWFDLTNQTWKVRGASAFAVANATLVGIAICDTAGCKAARSFEFAAAWSATNTVKLFTQGNANLVSQDRSSVVSVAGKLYTWAPYLLNWDTSLNMASGLTIANSTTYYAYVSELGTLFLDTERPYNRPELQGLYHPYHLWRSMGIVTTDGSAHLTQQFPRLEAAAVGVRGIATTAASGTVTQSDSWTDTSASFTGSSKDLGITAYIVTEGRAVNVELNAAIASGTSYIQASMLTGTGVVGYISCHLTVSRDGTPIGVMEVAGGVGSSTGSEIMRTACGPGAFKMRDTPPAGKHAYTWSIQAFYRAFNGVTGSANPSVIACTAIGVIGTVYEDPT